MSSDVQFVCPSLSLAAQHTSWQLKWRMNHNNAGQPTHRQPHRWDSATTTTTATELVQSPPHMALWMMLIQTGKTYSYYVQLKWWTKHNKSLLKKAIIWLPQFKSRSPTLMVRYLPWERGQTPNWNRNVAFSACFPLLPRAKKLACAHQLERCIGGMHSCSSCRWARAPNCSFYKRKRPFYMPCLLANIFSASQKNLKSSHAWNAG